MFLYSFLCRLTVIFTMLICFFSIQSLANDESRSAVLKLRLHIPHSVQFHHDINDDKQHIYLTGHARDDYYIQSNIPDQNLSYQKEIYVSQFEENHNGKILDKSNETYMLTVSNL